MNKENKFSIHSRLKSFKYAFAGVIDFFRTEHNAWLHLLATIYVVVLAVFLKVSRTEGIALIIVVAFVWVSEMLNTCVEKTMDLISEEYHPKIKVIKDLAAGAVLVAAIAALLTGILVFVPKFMHE
jgi:diacylglycerol kinase (ATP)